MDKIEQTEQWLLEGNCDICRRKKYCNKPCKEAKLADQRMIANLARQVMLNALIGKSK